MQIQQQQVKNRISVRSFNQIQIDPSPINNIFYCPEDNNVYVSRQKSTEVYHVIKTLQNSEQIQFQHIARLPFSKYAIKINNVLLLFLPFQLRVFVNNSWEIHNFTTQLLSINFKRISATTAVIYAFHQQQSVQYRISSGEDDQQFSSNHLSKGRIPYHITKQSIVEGFGKRIAPSNKSNSFTVCEWKDKDYVLVGDIDGALHVYDYKTLGHLKTFKRHIGPILTIKIDQKTDTIFYSGSDSKIVSITRVNGDWVFSSQIRGQSHDIMTLQLVNDTLISGGLTTDICCYPIHKEKQILQNYVNRISYRSESVVNSMRNLLLINKINSFQLWKIRQTQGDLQFLVRYQFPSQKYIKDIKLSKKLADNTHLIVASTEIDTVGWKFSQNEGLVKLFTIQNSYEHIQFLIGKNIFIGLRDSGQIQKVYCKTGKIDQIANSQVSFPTDFKLIGLDKLIIASNLTNVIKVFDLKKKALISKTSLTKIYQVLTEKSDNQFMIKYVGDNMLYSCNFQKKTIQQKQLFQLPQNSGNIRYGGVIVHESQVTKNHKKYWYFANENKVFIVNNLNTDNKRKVVRSIYTRQIGTVVKPRVNKSFQLGIVHFNFKRMINNMQIKPVLAKKIN